MPGKTMMVGTMFASIIGCAAAYQAMAQTNKNASERNANQAASSLYQVLNGQADPTSNPPATSVGATMFHHDSEGKSCAADQLIHAEMNSAIMKHVKQIIVPAQKGVQVRETAKLTFPCGFEIDPQSGWNLILSDGPHVRRYLENNAFGFAPAFGFGASMNKSYTMQYRDFADGGRQKDSCTEQMHKTGSQLQLCSSFGSKDAFFATEVVGGKTRLGHYVFDNGQFRKDFSVAEIGAKVESVFFLAPPDAPGGTITLIVKDSEGTYRVFVDTSRG